MGEDMVDTATEAMVVSTVVSVLRKLNPLQLLKLMLMPMLIAMDMVDTMEDMVDTMEDTVDMGVTEDMGDTTVANGLPKQSPLQLPKLMLMLMLIALDMVDTMEDMADTMEDMVDTGAIEDMVDTTVASVRLMLMPIAMVASVATEVMVLIMVDTVDMDMVDMATGDKQIYIVSS